MEYMPVIAAAIAALAAVVTAATFWMNRGKAEQKASEAATAAAVACGKADLVAAHLADYNALVAHEYVSIAAIDKMEQRIVTEVHRASDEHRAASSEINKRFDELARTLIEALASAAASTPPAKRRSAA